MMTSSFRGRLARCTVVFTVLLVAHAASAQDGRARLEGAVNDGTKPVVGALAIANDYQSVWQMKTDPKGEFSFFVPAGCYDVLLSSPLFHPSVKRVCVASGEVKKLQIKLKREASPKLSLSKN
jgi:hypothetical protein